MRDRERESEQGIVGKLWFLIVPKSFTKYSIKGD